MGSSTVWCWDASGDKFLLVMQQTALKDLSCAWGLKEQRLVTSWRLLKLNLYFYWSKTSNKVLPEELNWESWAAQAHCQVRGINLKESWQAIKALFSWAVKSLEWIKLCWILVQTVISARAASRGFGSKQTKPPLQGSWPRVIDLFAKFRISYLFCVKCIEQRLGENQTGKFSCIYLTGFCLLLGSCWAFPNSFLYESLPKYQTNFKNFSSKSTT